MLKLLEILTGTAVSFFLILQTKLVSTSLFLETPIVISELNLASALSKF